MHSLDSPFFSSRPSGIRSHLSRLDWSQLASLQRFLQRAPSVAQYRPPILFGYHAWDKTHLGLHKDLLLLESGEGDGVTLYAAGHGPLSEEACAILEGWQCLNRHGRILLAEACLPESPAWQARLREAASMHNYVLSVEHLNAGQTAGMRRKRRCRDRFQQLRPGAKLQRLDPQDKVQSVQIDEFFRCLGEETPQGCAELERDTKAFQYCLRQADDLGIEILGVVDGGTLLAIQAFEFPEGDCFYSSYCRVLRSMPCLYEFFDLAVSEQAAARGYRFYNIGEDLGLERVRRGKQGWEPVHQVRLFELPALAEP